MRKILSLVLVAVLALGMGMTAFADTNYGGSSTYDYTNIKGFADGSLGLVDGVTESTATNATVTKKNRTVDMGTRYAMDEPKLTIDLWQYMFSGDTEGGSSTTTEYYVVNVDKMYKAGKLTTSSIADWTAFKGALVDAASTLLHPANFVDSTKNGGTTYANAYQAALAFINYYESLGYVTTSNTATVAFFDNVNPSTGASASSNYFVNTTTTNNNDRLTSNQITKSKITMGTTVSGNSSLIRSLVLEKSDGQIVLKLLKEFVSVVDDDMEVEIYLSFDGKRASDYSLTVYATLDNPILEVYANHDRVDIAKGYIAKAYEFNTGIAVYTGNGVTVHTKMFKDKKYYCIATRDADQADTQVFNEYRDVDNVITMKAVGLNNSDCYVTLSTDYSGYYVYDQNMNYLGRGDERLEYCKKYYLANKELDIGSDDDDEEEEEYEAPTSEAPAGNPGTGGSPAATNANLNPGTGR